MTKPQNPNQQLLQLMLRAQYLAQQDPLFASRSDRGYAMVIVSIISIFMFSLLVAYMTITNLTKSSTNAYIDGSNSFYAAESGLNRRAQQLREKFVGYATPSGLSPGQITTASIVSPANISNCFPVAVATAASITSNDFECRNYGFKYNNNAAESKNSNGEIVLSEQNDNRNSVNYVAYTFVADKTNYSATLITNPRTPDATTIPAGDNFSGLKSQEYKYTVYSTANANQNVAAGFTTEEIGAKNREKVPATMLIGDNDLITSYNTKKAQADAANASRAASNERMNTVLQMDFKTRIIPIFQFGAFYGGDLEFNPSPPMTFNGRVHSNGSMYLTAGNGNTLTIDGVVTSASRIYTGNPALVDTYSAEGQVLITKSPGVTTALLPTNADPTTTAEQVTNLTAYNNQVKDITSGIQSLTLPPAGLLTTVDTSQPGNIGEYYGKADLRLEMFPDRSVPFNLQVIASGTGIAAGTGQCTVAPFANTVSTNRQNYSTARCTNLNEGQLRSLMQPVLVRPRTDLEYATFCTNIGAGTPPQTSSPIVITNTDLVVKERILDALSLTLAAQIAPVRYATLTTNSLSTAAKAQFAALLAQIPTLTPADITTLQGATPAQIAALSSTTTNTNTIKGGCFRPAPIQALFNPSDFATTAALAANTPTNFNDRREGRYIRMLQTNIESMTLWNRDGLFTQGVFDDNLTTSETITPANLANQFTIDTTTKNWTERATSSGNDLLFVKDIARTFETDGTTPILAQSYRGMGLAAVDRTEGGLVIHATIDKTNYSYTAFQSPYGFAFNDGMALPAPLTIATDRALYSQGDWNVFDKQPASLLADSLNLLSNNCLANSDSAANANNPAYVSAQLNCGKLAGINPATTTTVNAAFLARTDRSISTGTTYYNGGLNNYMRILEDWSGIAMNYRGSFVSLGSPQEVSGRYAACSRPGGVPTVSTYGCPPNRNWAYETDFDTFNKLPPLSPRVIELKQEVFKRTY